MPIRRLLTVATTVLALLGAALLVNPNPIRAVYRRLAAAGYVTSRHGAGTHVAEGLPQLVDWFQKEGR